MENKFAKYLIKNNNIENNISDIIWKNYSFNDYKVAKCKISKELAKEFSIFLENKKLEVFGEMINNREAIIELIGDFTNKNIVKSIAKNPYSNHEILSLLVEKYNCSEAKNRILVRENLLSNLDGKIDEIIKNFDANFISNISLINYKIFIDIISKIEDKDQRFLILDQCSNADRIIYDLLIGDFSESNLYIDSNIANWLIYSGSELAKVARELIDKKVFIHNIYPKLTKDAYILLSLDEKYQNFIYKKTFVNKNTTTKSTLESLVLLGSSSNEIANLVFNSNIELSIEEFSNYVSNCSLNRIINYIQGDYLRKPSKDEIELLANVIKKNKIENYSNLFDETKIKNLPWYKDLIIFIPNLFHNLENEIDFELIYPIIKEELSDNEKSWEIFLAMSAEWNGSLKDLLIASVKL
jgi:hypothetical protein